MSIAPGSFPLAGHHAAPQNEAEGGKTMFKLLLALALTCLGLTATAEELCATKDTAAYAAHPNQGPKSPAKLKVVKGRSYSVAPRIDGWVGSSQAASSAGLPNQLSADACRRMLAQMPLRSQE